MHETRTANRLIHESSPYLLQHAHNPVDWYPWGDEAFAKAKEEDKPILLSCGYSACHWCHVMERESFENPDIAVLMNRYFVNIKVDREERPDIDQIYQQAVQAITGQGGWPLTAFLDQERRPFYGGTYYPPERRYGRLGFPELLELIHGKWVAERDQLFKAGNELADFLEKMTLPQGSGEIPGSHLPKMLAVQIMRSFDPQHGGFGRAPKFPNPTLLHLLFRVGKLENLTQAIEQVIFSLERMARGGIYDQIGGGFHRYSTDERWLVPHFEKMLYDNGQLLRLYSIGYQLNQAEEFRRVVRETADYVRREMTALEGGFYATQDADSEGEEGKYFLWDVAEVKELLTPDEAGLVLDYYHLSERGNFEGRNILYRTADQNGQEAAAKIDPIKAKLLQVREQRVKPFRDEKIITSWNGLMIGGLAYAYQVFQRREDYDTAVRAAEFAWDKARLPDGKLARIYKDGQAKVPAMLDDYAFLAQGFLDLFEAGFRETWLNRSLELTEAAIRTFGDGQGRYYLTAAAVESLVSRPLSGSDQAIPSGVSVQAANLLRLAALTGNAAFREEAERIFEAYHQELQGDGWGYAEFLGVLELYHKGLKEFVFVSTDHRLPDLLQKLWQVYQPARILLWRQLEGQAGVATIVGRELWEGRNPIGGQPTCYICFDYKCLPPVTEWRQLEELL